MKTRTFDHTLVQSATQTPVRSGILASNSLLTSCMRAWWSNTTSAPVSIDIKSYKKVINEIVFFLKFTHFTFIICVNII